MENLKQLPQVITKKFFYQNYIFSKRMVRKHINFYVKMYGGNIRCHNLNHAIVIHVLSILGTPDGYTLSENFIKKIEYLRDPKR